MQLTPAQVNQFQTLFSHHAGQDLTYQQAEHYGTEIVDFIRLALSVSEPNIHESTITQN